MNTGTTSTSTTTILRTYLEFDPHHPATRGLLADAQKAHRLTMSPFAYALEEQDFYTGARTGHANHRSEYNILWAVNHSQVQHSKVRDAVPPRVQMMLQADIPPDFNYWRCQEWIGALMHPPVTREHIVTATEGHNIAYQLIFEPRRNIRIDGNRKTVVARHGEQILDWWRVRAAAAGLTLATNPIIDKPGELTSAAKKDLCIRHFRVTGKATITDSERYTTAARSGIGSARAYGCGLLLTK